MFARTAAFGLIALIATVPVASAAPDLDCVAQRTLGYHTAPSAGLAGDVTAKAEALGTCFVGYDTDAASPLPQVQVQFVPYLPAVLEGAAQPMPAPVRPTSECREGFECSAPLVSTSMQNEDLLGLGLELPPVEAPIACIQVWPYSAACNLAYVVFDLLEA